MNSEFLTGAFHVTQNRDLLRFDLLELRIQQALIVATGVGLRCALELAPDQSANSRDSPALLFQRMMSGLGLRAATKVARNSGRCAAQADETPEAFR